MANKENKLARAGHRLKNHMVIVVVLVLLKQKAPRQNTVFGCPPAPPPPGGSQNCKTMAQILFRNLRLNIALAVWEKRSISEVVA